MYAKLKASLAGLTIDIACFSRNGQRLLTVQEEGTARIWDLQSQDLLGEIVVRGRLDGDLHAYGHSPFKTHIEAAVLNCDGSMGLLGLNDGSAGLFDLQGRRLLTLTEPGQPPSRFVMPIRGLAFSEDESILAVGFCERKLALWDVDGDLLGTLGHPLADQEQPDGWWRDHLTNSLHFSSDDRHIFAGFGDKTAGVWDITSGALLLDGRPEDSKSSRPGPLSPYPGLHAANVNACFWHWEGQIYFHLGDYLRGGYYHLPVSPDQRYSMTRDKDNLSLLKLENPPVQMSRLNFEGSFLTGWMDQNRALALNDQGHLFYTPINLS